MTITKGDWRWKCSILSPPTSVSDPNKPESSHWILWQVRVWVQVRAHKYSLFFIFSFKGVFPVVALPRGFLLQSLSRNQSQGHHFLHFIMFSALLARSLRKQEIDERLRTHFSEVQLLLFLEIFIIGNRTSFRFYPLKT